MWKSPIVVKVSCVFSHWWEERTNTKEGWRWGWKAARHERHILHEFMKRGRRQGLLLFFHPCFSLPYWDLVKSHLALFAVLFLHSCRSPSFFNHFFFSPAVQAVITSVRPSETYLWCTHTHWGIFRLMRVLQALNFWENEAIKILYLLSQQRQNNLKYFGLRYAVHVQVGYSLR